MCGQADKRFGIGQCKRMGSDDIRDDLLYFFNIGIVRYVEGHIHAAILFGRIVFDNGVCKSAVRESDAFVVDGYDNGIYDGDLGDCSYFTGCFDEVSDLERFEEEDHESACEVAERSLQGKTDGNTAGCEDRNKGCGGNAEYHCNRYYKQNVEKNITETDKKRSETDIETVKLF